MNLQFTSITKSTVKDVLDLQITCDESSSHYKITLPESYAFNIINRESCTVVLIKNWSFLKIANIREEIGSVIIDNEQKWGEYTFGNTYALQWFENNNTNPVQTVNFVAIQCMSKIYLPIFKDKIKLEICADGNQCIDTQLIFDKSQIKDINQTISFTNYLMVKLWYVEYGILSSLSLIDTTTITDNIQDTSISFFKGSGHYNILLEI
jgi:hypothetical protein